MTIRVKISNTEKQFASIDFDTQDMADAYISSMKESEHWGKSDKDIIITPEFKDENGNVTSPAVIQHQNAEVFFATEDVTAQVQIEKRALELEASGKDSYDPCQKCLNIIRGHNKEKQFNHDQIISEATTFANLKYALDLGMPKDAKPLVTALVPDEVIVTTELKNILLFVLKDF